MYEADRLWRMEKKYVDRKSTRLNSSHDDKLKFNFLTLILIIRKIEWYGCV